VSGSGIGAPDGPADVAYVAHHVNIAGDAICPELDEKRKCFAEHVKEAATAATSSGSLAMLAAMRRASSRVSTFRCHS
jgi:hypothetical protein